MLSWKELRRRGGPILLLFGTTNQILLFWVDASEVVFRCLNTFSATCCLEQVKLTVAICCFESGPPNLPQDTKILHQYAELDALELTTLMSRTYKFSKRWKEENCFEPHAGDEIVSHTLNVESVSTTVNVTIDALRMILWFAYLVLTIELSKLMRSSNRPKLTLWVLQTCLKFVAFSSKATKVAKLALSGMLRRTWSTSKTSRWVSDWGSAFRPALKVIRVDKTLRFASTTAKPCLSQIKMHACASLSHCPLGSFARLPNCQVSSLPRPSKQSNLAWT